MPVDTINKYWGIDSNELRFDEIVQKQSYEQSSRNFWSCIDANTLFLSEKFNNAINRNVRQVEQTKVYEYTKPVISYAEARQKASEGLAKR